MHFIKELVISHNLNSIEQTILTYTYDHCLDVERLSIRTVAFATFTSTTTIFKTAKKLGFIGYSELLFEFRKQRLNTAQKHSSQLPPLQIDALSAYTNDFTQLLLKHRNTRIFLLGIGYSEIAIKYLQDKLQNSGFNAVITTHLQIIFNHQFNDSLLIVISESGKNTRLLELVENAKSLELDILSFTTNPNSPIALASLLHCPIIIPDEHLNLKAFTPITMLLFDYLLQSLQK
ncbi:MAG: MurR/RpiR family transcriptional regulator [Culicoidibacterales bacterium]